MAVGVATGFRPVQPQQLHRGPACYHIVHQHTLVLILFGGCLLSKFAFLDTPLLDGLRSMLVLVESGLQGPPGLGFLLLCCCRCVWWYVVLALRLPHWKAFLRSFF